MRYTNLLFTYLLTYLLTYYIHDTLLRVHEVSIGK